MQRRCYSLLSWLFSCKNQAWAQFRALHERAPDDPWLSLVLGARLLQRDQDELLNMGIKAREKINRKEAENIR